MSFREHLLSTRKSSPFPLVDDEGRLAGPFGHMEKLEGLGFRVADLGEGLRFHGTLSDTQREAAILWISWRRNCEFEAWAHSKVARAQQCLSDEDIEALCEGRLHDIQDNSARQAAEVTESILQRETGTRAGSLADDGARTLLEFIVLVYYYEMLAHLMRTEGPEDTEK